MAQELMGHAGMEMTLRYAHLSPESKPEAVKLLGPQNGARQEPGGRKQNPRAQDWPETRGFYGAGEEI